MGFGVGTRQFGDVTVIDIRGRFTLIEGEAIHDLLMDLFREGRKKVLLNLQAVTYLDSSGIGQLIRGFCTANKNGAELKAVDLSSRAQEVLQVTNLHTILTDFPDERDALRSFFSS
ncbi:MAG TPA: STAS domain-containing protein [Candidatus Acidoferrales bacterium]